MGAIVAGDILEIQWSNPKFGTGVWLPKSNEDGNLNTGGFRANDDKNMITGSGKPIVQLNNTMWSLETTIAWDMAVANEVEVVSNLTGDSDETTFTITMIGGTIWGGVGRPVGDIAGNTNTGVLPIKLAGGGKLEKQ